MDYSQISKETISYLHKSYNSLKNSPLDSTLRVLVELRVSQINGCAYCCSLHSQEAKELGVPQEKIESLPNWQISPHFSDAEKAALTWCEAVNCLDKNLNMLKDGLFKYYSERQIVDLTACVALMNALNRLAISMKEK